MVDVFNIPVEKLNLLAVGGETPELAARVLKGSLKIGNGNFHVYALQVESNDQGALELVHPAYEEELQCLYTLNGDDLSTISIGGREYVLVVYPYAR